VQQSLLPGESCIGSNIDIAINRELREKFLQCSSHFCQVSHALVAIVMHSIDIAINRELWDKFLQCSSHFCQVKVSHALVAIVMHSIDIAMNR
jgi:hypothetical protein